MAAAESCTIFCTSGWPELLAKEEMRSKKIAVLNQPHLCPAFIIIPRNPPFLMIRQQGGCSAKQSPGEAVAAGRRIAPIFFIAEDSLVYGPPIT
jgi:hypothetical protein